MFILTVRFVNDMKAAALFSCCCYHNNSPFTERQIELSFFTEHPFWSRVCEKDCHLQKHIRMTHGQQAAKSVSIRRATDGSSDLSGEPKEALLSLSLRE